jgi:hypothetical protein
MGAAVLAAVCAVPAMATPAVVGVSSGTGLPVTSGTGVMVSPGTGAVAVISPGITHGRLVSTDTIAVTDSNTAVMGAPAGSTVTVTNYAMPAPPANGYLSGDYQRYLNLGR